MCVTPNPHARELGIATVGDSDRPGKFMVTKTFWNSDGVLYVTIQENTGEAIHINELLGKDLERARALARRCLMHPEKTRSAAVENSEFADGNLNITFAVSRND